MEYAYPHKRFYRDNQGIDHEITENGMTLRDYFAANATDADVEKFMEIEWDFSRSVPWCWGPKYTREQARYRYADAMLEARK